MNFVQYHHIEKLGHQDVEDILEGEVFVYPKLDGTNASVWIDEQNKFCAGSRNRELSVERDNAGFLSWAKEQENLSKFLNKNKGVHLFGEWLCLSGDTKIKKASGGKKGVYLTLRDMYNYLHMPRIEKNYYETRKENKICYYIRTKSWWQRYGMPKIFSLYLDQDRIRPNRIKNIIYSGKKEVYRIITRKGFSIKTTDEHLFFTPCGFIKLKDLKVNDCVGITGFNYDYEFDKIIEIKYVGFEDCYDISMEGEENEANFVADGFIVHNCPHSLKTYRKDAWKRFWVFDVWRKGKLFPVEDFDKQFEEYNIDYIPGIAKINKPTEEQLINTMNSTNTFLIQDGLGVGEGIVIKRYNDWKNKYGRQTWAKMVRNEFKEMNRKSFGLKTSKGKDQIEEKIIQEFVGSTLVHKELAKIITEYIDKDYPVEGYQFIARQIMITNKPKIIPRLLQTVFYALISEEMWPILKKYKRSTIDFGKLERFCVERVKELAPELF